MNEESVFIDTSFFKAFVDEDDDFHTQAVRVLKILEQREAKLVTTNYVLDEAITLIRVRCGVLRVKDFQRALVALKPCKIIRVFGKDESGAWDWFWNDWHHLSFTDCVSFAVMKRLGLTDVATFDEHFARAGFNVVT